MLGESLQEPWQQQIWSDEETVCCRCTLHYTIHWHWIVFSNKSENCFRTVTITDLTCPIVKVSNAGAEDGLYEVIEDIRVKWAEERQVYRNSDSDRYGENIFGWFLLTFWFVDTCSLEKERGMDGQLGQSRGWKQEKASITVKTPKEHWPVDKIFNSIY